MVLITKEFIITFIISELEPLYDKETEANYTFKPVQSLSLDEKTLFKTPKMKYAPCPSLCSHVPRQTYKLFIHREKVEGNMPPTYLCVQLQC